MHKKTDSLWRYLRTPVLLTSATVFVFGCASQNPLIDEEADPVELTQSIPAHEEAAPVQQEYPVIEKTAPAPDEYPVIQEKLSAPKPERQHVTKASTPKSEPKQESELNTEPTGMKKWLGKLSPYRTNIQQGNFISSEMLAKIQPGMTKEQVRFVLGTPLLTDMFHANRWDYLFRLQKPYGSTTTNRVTIFFSGTIVNRVVSDDLPNEAAYLSHITSDDEQTDKKETVQSGQAAEPSRAGYPTPSDSTYDNPDARPETETVAAPDDEATPEMPAVPVPAARTESVRQPEPVSTPEPARVSSPVRTPQPVSAPEPVRAPAPVIVSEPSGNTEQASRLTRQGNKRPQVKTLPEDPKDDENTASENLGTFESISTPSRVGRMLPPSPNDELIGNIQ